MQPDAENPEFDSLLDSVRQQIPFEFEVDETVDFSGAEQGPGG